DTIMIEKVFTEVLEYNEFLRFIIPVHKEAIYNENFIKNITLLLKKYHIENRVILEVVNTDTVDYRKALLKLKSAGLKLSTIFTSLNDLKDLELFNIVFLNFNADKKIISSLSKTIKDSMGIEVVLFNSDEAGEFYNISDSYRTYTKEDIIKMK
nr:hypothetical protein [Gammaproteobacteria bacterium]